MKVEALTDATAVARQAATVLASRARAAVADRGRFVMAVSGGRTPWQMLRVLANEDLPWEGVHVVQVDERIAPDGDPDRNLTHLIEFSARPCTPAPSAASCHASCLARPDGSRRAIRAAVGGDRWFAAGA